MVATVSKARGAWRRDGDQRGFHRKVQENKNPDDDTVLSQKEIILAKGF